MGNIVSRAEFAKIIGRSPPTVGNMIADGMPAQRTGKKGAEVKIDTAIAIEWWFRKRETEKAGGIPGSREDEELRLIKARADKTETEAAQLREELGRMDDFKQALNSVMVIISSQLDGLAGRQASELANIDNPAEIREILLDECRRIRSAAANRLQNFAGHSSSSGAIKAATEESTLEVG